LALFVVDHGVVTLDDDLQRVTHELEAARDDLVRSQARVAALEVERDRLAAALAARVPAKRGRRDLSALDRTDAILHVLRAARLALTTGEVTGELREAGRPEEEERVVGATLHYLFKRDLARRPARGKYAA
jgi:hypothetical protein